MSAPIIGITAGIYADTEDGGTRLMLGESYVIAILRAGGIPLVIPPGLPEDALETVRARLDAILFTGGPDVEPALFNGAPHPEIYGVDPRRDSTELGLARASVRAHQPLLGICRGIQVINVALGGGLYTHIADQLPGALKHDYYPDYARDYEAHPVRIEADSLLASIVGAQAVRVNSLHHQGLSNAAPGLKAVACAPDGLIEAVEVQGQPFGLGVQWHPECMPDSPQMQAIFRAFVRAAGK